MLPSRDRQGAFFWARRQRSCFCYGRPSRGPFAIPTTFHTSTNSPAASRPESWWTPISIGGRIPNAWAGVWQDTKRLGRRLRQLGAQEVSVMLIEPLTLPLPTEEAIRRFYGLP